MKKITLGVSGSEYLAARITRDDLAFEPRTVWCPSPSYSHRVAPYPVPRQVRISTHDTEESGSRLTPTPFAVVVEGQGRAALIGVRADSGWHRWNTVSFKATAGGVNVQIDFEGHSPLREAMRHVEVGVVEGQAGERRIDLLARGLRLFYPAVYRQPSARQPSWWRRPIYCGYGDQVAASLVMEGPGAEARALAYCTQGLYERWVRRLDEAGVPIGTVTIDAGWSPGGVWQPNRIQWPDLREFIRRQHDQGRKVLLWIATWLTEGLPDDWCVFAGKTRLVANPLHPRYRSFLIEQVQRLLSDAKDGYGADGFKIDQLSYTPNERWTWGGEHFGRMMSVKRHPPIRFAGQAWGCELLYALQKTIYTAAKAVKPDALITSSTVHPMFHDSFDMVRLHDTGRAGRVVLEAMKPRAELSRAVFPDKPIDADDWVPFDYDKWLRYTVDSHQLGVPCLFYAERFVKALGSKAETLPIPLRDLRKLAGRWRGL